MDFAIKFSLLLRIQHEHTHPISIPSSPKAITPARAPRLPLSAVQLDTVLSSFISCPLPTAPLVTVGLVAVTEQLVMVSVIVGLQSVGFVFIDAKQLVIVSVVATLLIIVAEQLLTVFSVSEL